jgi:uncharacterized protein (DUF1778 family)
MDGKRINLREVPEDVYETLTKAAAANRQSLNAFVVDRISEIAKTLTIANYMELYEPPRGTNITLEDAAAAVRDVREAS